MRITACPGLDQQKVKFKITIRPGWATVTPTFIQASLVAQLQLIRQVAEENVAVDRGHRHSNGYSEICIWVGPRPPGPAIKRELQGEDEEESNESSPDPASSSLGKVGTQMAFSSSVTAADAAKDEEDLDDKKDMNDDKGKEKLGRSRALAQHPVRKAHVIKMQGWLGRRWPKPGKDEAEEDEADDGTADGEGGGGEEHAQAMNILNDALGNAFCEAGLRLEPK